MSVYEEVETVFTHLDILLAAIREAGLTATVYPEHDGVYRMWRLGNRETHDNSNGLVRGKDATVVIHGGLDTWEPKPGPGQDQVCITTPDGKLRGGPGWYCGDTAFVYDETTGRYRAEIDEAHGNAHLNWCTIKDNYAVLTAEHLAEKAGLRSERAVNAQGRPVVRVYPKTDNARIIKSAVRG